MTPNAPFDTTILALVPSPARRGRDLTTEEHDELRAWLSQVQRQILARLGGHRDAPASQTRVVANSSEANALAETVSPPARATRTRGNQP